MQGTEYRVLGPLEVLFDGKPVPLPSGKGRVLLATLLLRANQFVSTDELVTRLWDDSHISTDRVAKTLQMTVTRLRQALGPANCVTTSSNGYLAEVDNLDLLRFRSLAATDPHSALALWRGPALQNVVSDALHREEVPVLAEERLVVLERRIEQDLDDGHAADLVPELRALTAEHPLRERFWAQLMIALYRSHQQAAALEAYRQVSSLLADELGIDPGSLLQEVHQSILRAEPTGGSTRPDTAVPRQLPPDLARFTGRTDDLAALDRLLPSDQAGQAVVISAIAGSAGVGKTALAVHWAHRVRDRFPDGQLAVNLRGYDREDPVTPHDALGQLLRGLGRSSKDIPNETTQRIGEYRSLLADRRVLVLLDNARTADQVRPLLPAGGRSVVVITSRSDLRGLVALNDAKVLKLGVLPLNEAIQLLENVIGTDRARAEAEATAELARLCACLPLALRIAASLLASEPHLRVRDLVDQLDTENRLAELEIGDDEDAAVRAAFDLSYTALAPEEQRMFRMIGLAPRADLTPQSAGALLGVPSGRALKLLRVLARAHLVEEHAPQRFSQHDLLRLHARECVAAQEPSAEQRAAVVRFLDHHLHSVDSADRVIRRSRMELPLTDREDVVELVGFRDKGDAMSWFRTWHDMLLELCEFALAHGHLEHAWQIPSGMWGYLIADGSTEDFLRLNTIALDAARQLGNRYAEASALHTLGYAHRNTGNLEESLRLLHEALRLRRDIGHTQGMASTSGTLAGTYRAMGRYDEALHHDRQHVEYRRIIDDGFGLGTALNSLAWTLVVMGDYEEGARIADEAADVFAALGVTDEVMQDTRAKAKYGMGDLDGAVRVYREIFAKSLDHVSSAARVEILLNGAEVLGVAGDRPAALRCAREALSVTEHTKLKGADKIRELVRELEGG
ncbi:BTAD domain-containing putative transcriptional regulator [Lentzea sp. NPDC004789]